MAEALVNCSCVKSMLAHGPGWDGVCREGVYEGLQVLDLSGGCGRADDDDECSLTMEHLSPCRAPDGSVLEDPTVSACGIVANAASCLISSLRGAGRPFLTSLRQRTSLWRPTLQG